MTGYVALDKAPTLEDGVILVIARERKCCSRRVRATSSDERYEYRIHRKLGFGLHMELEDTTGQHNVPLLAQKGPFSHVTTISTPSQGVLTKLLSKCMRSGNTFEYKGKTYRWNGHDWSFPFRQELLEPDSGKVLAAFKWCGLLKNTCEMHVHAKDKDSEWMSVMLLAAMVTFRQHKRRQYGPYADVAGC